MFFYEIYWIIMVFIFVYQPFFFISSIVAYLIDLHNFFQIIILKEPTSLREIIYLRLMYASNRYSLRPPFIFGSSYCRDCIGDSFNRDRTSMLRNS